MTILFTGFNTMAAHPPETKIYNPTVREAMRHFDESNSQSRSELVFINGTKVTNCIDYIKASNEAAIIEHPDNQEIQSEYLICNVLSLLGRRKYIIPKVMPKLGEALAENLDLRSFDSTLSPLISDKQFTLAHLKGNLKIGATKVSLVTEFGEISLEVIATADVTNNGKADWIVWLMDVDKQNKTVRYQTLLACDVDLDENLIRVMQK
jgi:hypothetical protein